MISQAYVNVRWMGMEQTKGLLRFEVKWHDVLKEQKASAELLRPNHRGSPMTKLYNMHKILWGKMTYEQRSLDFLGQDDAN